MDIVGSMVQVHLLINVHVAAKDDKENAVGKVYVVYNSPYESGGEICKGDEDSDYPFHEDTYYSFNLVGVFSKPRNSQDHCEGFDSDLKIDDKAFVVVVRYSSGYTFGHSSGHAHIAGVFATRDEADKLQDSIQNDKNDGYKPWNGYFNRLEYVSVEKVEVEP